MKPVIYFVLTFLVISCSSLNSKDKESLRAIEARIAVEPFTITIDAAYPQNTLATQRVVNDLLISRGDNASRIDLMGDGFTIKIENGLINAQLPFYGEQRLSAGNYNSGGGISIVDQEISNSYSFNEKGYLETVYRVNDVNGDLLQINLRIGPNSDVNINMNSAQKSFMRYTGRLQKH
ncbi:MAG: DUF4251 domain-containing protein [Nonlabens sp.]